MFSEETSVFSVECYFAMFSDIAKTGSGSSRALSELVEFIFPLPYLARGPYPKVTSCMRQRNVKSAIQ